MYDGNAVRKGRTATGGGHREGGEYGGKGIAEERAGVKFAVANCTFE